MDVLKALSEIGVVPVIKLTDVSKAEKLAEALVAGGVPCAEVTFRAAGADEAIRRMRAACPELLVGAGTVLKVEQAEAALDAGAQFLVSPGTNPEVVRYTQSRGSIIIPGVMTPTEIEQALSLGLTTPPYGLCLLIASSIADLSVERSFKGVLPYFLVCLAVLAAGVA